MSATLDTTPPARAFSKDPIWVVAETDETIASPASVVITISSTGPTAGQTLQIVWGGNDITFTVSGTDSESATDLPVIGADTLSDYADNFAERLRQNEVLHDYFAISRGTAGSDETVTLTQRNLEVVDITVTEDLSNVTAVANDVSAVTAAEGLRALLEVWQDTGDPATDVKLISLHSPYDLASANTWIDIRAAFAALKPHLPPTTSIDPTIFTALLAGEASDCWMLYYLRYADKAGYPAVAQALLRTDDSYYAMLGSIAADSTANATDARRHNYTRRDGAAFRKPTTATMPDWFYWVCPSGVAEIYVHVTIDWSDGTQSTFDPFDTDATAVEAGKMYYIGTGFRQLKLQTVTPSGGTDADAYIVGYRAAIARVDAVPLLGAHYVDYDVYYDQGDNTTPCLLFSNGLGGCESACFRGRQSVRYTTAAEEVQRPRPQGWSISDGEFSMLGANGRASRVINTGWYSDPYYLEHLRQMPMGDVWLIDTANQRFERVTVEPGEIEISRDDDTLFSLSFTIRAAWLDAASNV